MDRAARRRADAQWLSAAWARARVLVVDVVTGGTFLIHDGPPPQPAPPRPGPAPWEAPGPAPAEAGASVTAPPRPAPAVVYLDPAEAPEGERLFLGEDAAGTPYFAVDAPLPELAGTRAVTLRDVAHRLSDTDAGLVTAAAALAHWHVRHPYSAQTGRPTKVSEGGWVRTDDGGSPSWPRTDPAVIVLVHDGVAGLDGRCLLGHNSAWHVEGKPRFSCLAGFVEPGESAEATVAREVAEEVGVAVAGIRYVASQAWPFPASLMLGFFALADPAAPLDTDPAEIAEARWFTRREIHAALVDQADDFALSGPASIAHYLIESWAVE